MTILNEKTRIRLAMAIHEQLTAERDAPFNIDLPTIAWHQCENVLYLARRARRNGWLLAAQRMQRDFEDSLQRLKGELADIERMLALPRGCSHIASVRDIYGDLEAFEEEFDEVDADQCRRTLSVTTEPIELEGVYLGPFEIRLDWGNLATGHPYNYRVIALDAHPAAANESVTHPHVQDETVCEGEGRQAIRQAQQQGRLLDFFVIVANLLRTYNSSSPYVALADWEGVECSGCGGMVVGDERCVCEGCETALCGECVFHCPGCECAYCRECVTLCEGCDQFSCRGCMDVCPCCSTERCRDCLHEFERCAACHEEGTTQEEDEGRLGAGETYNPGAPLHADRLGQTAVPA